MSWGEYLFWAIVAVCLAALIVLWLGNLACNNAFGAAEESPQPTRRCDMRLVDQQTRRLQAQALDDVARKSAERRAASVQQRLKAVRLEGLAAALHDLAHSTRTECPYKGGSRSALNWRIAYNRALADCAEQAASTTQWAA